nr:MAG TPA: hypothetical protein [Caudoviricetes sp.]
MLLYVTNSKSKILLLEYQNDTMYPIKQNKKSKVYFLNGKRKEAISK